MLLAGLLAGMLPGVAGAQQIDTGTPTSGGSGFGRGTFSAGGSGYSSYTAGQTFRVPAAPGGGAALLQQFQFSVFGAFIPSGNPAFTYRAYVAAFDPALQRLSGPILYESEVRGAPDPLVRRPETFATGGLALAPGQQYVAFLAAPQLAGLNVNSYASADFVNGPFAGGAIPNDTYADGEAVFTLGPGTLASLGAATWTSGYLDGPREGPPYAPGADLVFTATFAPAVVPEPGSVLLVGAGLLALVPIGARARRATPGAA